MTDAVEHPVAGATVAVGSSAIMKTRTMRTGTGGTYRFTGLPPGVYDLLVERPGLQAHRHTNVRVSMGTTTRLDVVLQIAPLEVAVEVTAGESMIQPGRLETSTTLTADLLDDLPTLGRHYSDLLILAPGVVNQSGEGIFGPSNPNSHGARSDANQYFFDGGNTTDTALGLWGSRFNLDAIDHIEVMTAGYRAEYGRADGAIASIVTKSGGNEFAGTFRFDARDAALDKRGAGKELFQDLDFYRRYYSATLGGPIVRDRASFFVSLFALDEADARVFDGAPFPAQTTPTLTRDLFLKATWEINDAHQLAASIHHDSSLAHNANPFGYTSPSARQEQSIEGNYVLLRETGVLSPAALLETTAMLLTREARVDPDSDAPPSSSPWNGIDIDTGIAVGESTFHAVDIGDRSQLREDLSLFVGDAMGSHELKAGIGLEIETSSKDHRSEPAYWLSAGIPIRKTYQKLGDPYYDATNGSESRILSAYVQDAWTPTPGLTVNLGLRADYQAVKFRGLGGLERLGDAAFTPEDRPAERASISGLGLAPRLGFTWDPGRDGASAVRGSLARYYLTHHGLVGEWERYSLDYSFECDTDPQGNCLNERRIRSDFFLDRDLRLPHTDEVVVGYEREVVPDVAAGVMVIFRRSRDLPQDVEVNSMYSDANGDGFPETRTARNPNFADVYVLGNGDRSEYRGLELTLEKRLSRRWQLLSSYSYSVAKGDGEWTATGEGDDPRRNDAEYSFLNYDQRHVLKITGSCLLPLGLVLTGEAQYLSGTPYSILVPNFTDANGNGVFDLGEATPPGGHYWDGRNTHRNDDYVNLDLRLEKEFRVKSTIIGVFANVLNVFNDQSTVSTVAIIRPYNENCDPSVRDCFAPNEVTKEESRRFGRQFQLGFRISFGGKQASASVMPTTTGQGAPSGHPMDGASPSTNAVARGLVAPSPRATEETESEKGTYRPRRRTVRGTIKSIDAGARLLLVDMGVGKVATITFDDATEIEGELVVGKSVKIRTTMSTASTRVAVSIKVLD